MKKRIAFFLTLALVLGLLAGCAGTPVVYYTNCTCPTGSHDAAAPVVDETEAPAVSEGAVKTGLAILADVSGSKSADAENNGEAKYDVTLVAVTVDDNGVITDCIIDSVGASVAFSATGEPVDAAASVEVLTKTELGDAYGMKAYGGAAYEWYEQAGALADYAVGKTVEELKAGAVDETGHAADADLATSATIYLGGYVSAVEAAVANAQHLGAQAGDELKLTSINSLDATPGEGQGGAAQLSMDVTALTMSGDTITSCCIDALQAEVTFDTTGAITSDLAAPQTKNQLGEAYGMKAYAGSRYEWNEQAANFAAYVTGKTASDVALIHVDEATKPTDADLATSVTIAIGGFQNLIAKAVQ